MPFVVLTPGRAGSTLLLSLLSSLPTVLCEHELPGTARHDPLAYLQNRTVDWLLTPPSGPPIALDVKNRTKDLLESLMRVQAGERQADGTAPPPMHDPSILFTSLEPKFEPRSPRDVVQAAWIGTALKQEESELLSAFAQLDSARIHVVLLAGWRDDVYALSQDDHARRYVCDVLRVRESRRLVFRLEDLAEPLSGGDIEEA